MKAVTFAGLVTAACMFLIPVTQSVTASVNPRLESGGSLGAQSSHETELMYLSGVDADSPVKWDFRCSKGRNAGRWGSIDVPSCWEQQGFGDYTYGRFYLDKTARPSDETGEYRTTFRIPSSWKGKTVELVFEGVMTDASVEVNGKSAGPVHQGGFTSFCHDITQLLRFGGRNTLEVRVKKESDNTSVNAAERRADWWLFGGIYRPVYLRALPASHISNLSVDARADGTLNLEYDISGNADGTCVEVSVGGRPSRSFRSVAAKRQHLTSRWDSISAWDPEHPNLYELTLTLKDRVGNELHSHRETVGFRTLEFVPRDGFYLNGTRLVVKGVNRHCFYPETGRTTSRRLDREDVRLVKGMNVNAIRSHYPPDRHLLELCDSMGVLYFNELPGWQDAYDDEVGPRILAEMIGHDANHPCVFAWGNGNEGGFNYNLLPLFDSLDIQHRQVVHPWALKGGVDAHHYPAYQTGVGRLANGNAVFMPTEFLHSQYDKGGGASLDEFWKNYTRSPLFAGGFIWAMIDESVVRTDSDGKLDAYRGNAPDGILGPHREKEGSWFAIRDVWSPLQIGPVMVRRGRQPVISLSNHSLFSDLKEYTLDYEVVSATLEGGEETKASGLIEMREAAPGECVNLRVGPAGGFHAGDYLRLVARRAGGDTVNVWTFPMVHADEYHARSGEGGRGGRRPEVAGYSMSAAGVTVAIDSLTGMLARVEKNGRVIPFSDGPVPVGMKMRLTDISTDAHGDTARIVARYIGAVDSLVWSLTPDGSLGMDILMLNRKRGGGYKGDFLDDNIRNFGFSFTYPEHLCSGMTWIGCGPYRVWRNRQRGANFGWWHKDYNNTITGQSDGALVYPEFKGYHGRLYQAAIHSDSAPVRVRCETDGVYLRMFTPQEPDHMTQPGSTMVPFPEGDISFLLEIPPIRSYKPLEQLGPMADSPNVRINKGDEGLRMKLWFDF